jgi:hypothetical protein
LEHGGQAAPVRWHQDRRQYRRHRVRRTEPDTRSVRCDNLTRPGSDCVTHVRGAVVVSFPAPRLRESWCSRQRECHPDRCVRKRTHWDPATIRHRHPQSSRASSVHHRQTSGLLHILQLSAAGLVYIKILQVPVLDTAALRPLQQCGT